MAAGKNWHNLARETRQRREQLGLTQEEVLAAGGPAPSTQRLIENAARTSYRGRTFRDLDTGLRLEPGSARSALSGGKFRPLEGDPQPRSEDRTYAHLNSTPGLTDDEREAIKAFVRSWRESRRDAS